eukprot:CAMPEP_0117428464 /NCGR_PEP_ID=MMETSP0758-20121206/8166_1 /TAXON_ID=63605 /ORGANISM="Percolomonas cosmopolitus, Strain AE-1 (ATCC 50343)" /LENGTH=400 /DNA_ID=CAMNT_0005214835 /DNA_START=391 /DNA_END=1590 /DNA_ORIENTATION=-
MKDTKVNKKVITTLVKEIRSLFSISSPNVVPLLEVICQDKNVYLKLPYYEKMDLARYFLQKFNVEQYLSLGYQLFEGLMAIHIKDIIHLDIRPQNIFVKSIDDQVVNIFIGDFDVSRPVEKVADRQRNMSYEKRDTGKYIIAPEIDKKIFTKAADVYSAGQVLLKFLPNEGIDESIINMIKKCINNNHMERPSAYEMYKFFQQQNTSAEKKIYEDHVSFLRTQMEDQQLHIDELNGELFNDFPHTWKGSDIPFKSFNETYDVDINQFDKILPEWCKITQVIRNEDSFMWSHYSMKRKESPEITLTHEALRGPLTSHKLSRYLNRTKNEHYMYFVPQSQKDVESILKYGIPRKHSTKYGLTRYELFDHFPKLPSTTSKEHIIILVRSISGNTIIEKSSVRP